MSIQAKFLNFMLTKYVKNVQPPVEERSYIEARKMMNQEGYSDQDASFGSKILQKFIFKKTKSYITTNETYLNNIRACILHTTTLIVTNVYCIFMVEDMLLVLRRPIKICYFH